jgi:hypothetical protein
MNTNKIVAALVAALTAGSAFAVTPAAKTNYVVGDQIFIAGSTAMASKSMPAIATAATNLGYTLAASDSGATGALTTPGKIGLWTKVVTVTNGTTVSITTNAIDVHFIGSEGGTVVTASKTSQPFLPIGTTGKITGESQSIGIVTVSPACTLFSPATITFSDVNQSVGRFAAGSKTSPVKTTALTEIGSGINAVNFAFIAATNFPGSNITDQVARELLTVGHCPLSHITGNASDAAALVYATGRDVDSGTRSLTQIETGVGITTGLQQSVYDAATGTIFLTAGGTNAFNGVTYTAGNGGYFSGGDLCVAVGASATNSGVVGYATSSVVNSFVATSTNTNGAYLVGYAGTADILSKGKTVALSYNGVAPYATNVYAGFNNVNNGIANGSYSLWSIEHLYVNTANAPKGTVAADVTSLAQSLYNNLTSLTTTQLGSGYTALSDLSVKRSAAEGSVIISK